MARYRPEQSVRNRLGTAAASAASSTPTGPADVDGHSLVLGES
jgi:hypothetical protein